MNIFILEDSVYRIKLFNYFFSNHHLVFACNVEDAKNILLQQSFDMVFFDHDLDQCIFVPSSEKNTGYQLARWIRYDTDLHFKRVVVHSMNPLGAQKIAKKARKFCPDVRVIPFPFLFCCLKNNK